MSIAGFEKYLIRYLLPGLAFILLGGLIPAVRFRPDEISDVSLSQISLIVLAGLALGFILDAIQSSKLIPGRAAVAEDSHKGLQRALGIGEVDVRVGRDLVRTHLTEKQEAVWSDRTDRSYMALNLSLAAFLFSLIWIASSILRLLTDDGPAWIESDLRLSSALLFDNVGLFVALDSLLLGAYLLIALLARKSGLQDLATSYSLFRVFARNHRLNIQNDINRLRTKDRDK